MPSCSHGPQCLYCNDARPCRFPRCAALAAPGWHYCAVHHPEKVLARVEHLAFRRFARAIEASGAGTAYLLRRLYEDLLRDLKDTV